MKVENPVALRFILQDELYLLKADKVTYEIPTVAEPEIAEPAVEQAPVVLQTPTPVIIPSTQIPVVPIIETPSISFKYMGKNLKRFLVLTHYPNLEFIDDAHLTALTNIIKRKDLEVNDLAIVNIATYPDAKYDDLQQFFKPAKVLILGKNALPQAAPTLTLNTPKLLGGLSNLYSFSFGEMMDNVEYKKAFWEQVKGF
ncbi:hypothetical protein [Mucilaginibacter dorajii]|uniref:Uncharacterized protein n=1 Tax=Mucilaginibacter dorajii TaxID=692994 RepID=A0ABP7PSQ2_9SPHI|nr:hypothetical protein [Mucilaginibacter dorajii]MCS3736874.1 hypothetical protein [Mucilaginibacter dorajii]